MSPRPSLPLPPPAFAPGLRSLLLALLVALCVAGCGTDVDHLHPKVMHDVTLSTDHSGSAVAIERGSGIRLRLPPVPGASGLDWLIVGNNVRVLEQTSNLEPAATPAGGKTVTFFSLKPGKSIVRFALLNLAETESVVAKRIEITVVVKSDD